MATPNEMLEMQVKLLQAINEAQGKQTEMLNALRGQIAQLAAVQASNNVKIIDFNMPFGALVGMLIKVSLASIPAGRRRNAWRMAGRSARALSPICVVSIGTSRHPTSSRPSTSTPAPCSRSRRTRASRG